METKTVTELFPRKFPSHRLTRENTLDGAVPAGMVTVEKGTYFNKVAWKVFPDWKLRGYATPPIFREGEDAIVFEKLTPANPEGNYLEQYEPGIYWLHNTASRMKIVV